MSAFISCLRNSCKTFKPIMFQKALFQKCQTGLAARLSNRPNLQLNQQTRHRKDGSERLLIAGIMAMFGLDKDKEEDAPETDEEKLVHSIKLGILAMQRGDFEKSEFLLHVALKMAQDLQHENGIYYVYTVLGDLAFQQGDFKKCERLYLDIMKREIGRGVPQNANSLVEMSLKLARIFESRNELEKAEQGFKFCIDTQEKKLKQDVFNDGEDKEDVLGLWGMSRDYYAQFLLKQGRKSEALSQFQAAYDVCRDTYGESHPQALVLLNSMGTVSSLMGKDEQAVMYFEKAVRFGREIESDNLPTFLVNLGMAKIKAGLKAEAKKACQEAAKLAKKNKSEEEAQEADICLDLVKELSKSSNVKKN